MLIPEIYSHQGDDNSEELSLEPFIRYRNDFLQPQMNAKQAADIFEKTTSDALAVVNDLIQRRVIGQLSEAHTLRRYSEESSSPPPRGGRGDCLRESPKLLSERS